MKNFIYVFNDEDKQKLINKGLLVLKEDKENHVSVFCYDGRLNFDDDCLSKYIIADILTF